MVNVVIPLADSGARGPAAIQRLVAAARPAGPHRFTFVARPGSPDADILASEMKWIAPGAAVLTDGSNGSGPAGTVLHARDRINTADPLIVVLTDRLPGGGIDGVLAALEREHLDGVLLPAPLASGLAIDPDGRVTSLNEGTVAAFAFRRGCDFVRAACAVLAAGNRDAGSFTVAAVVNRLIRANATVGVYHPSALRVAA